MEEVCFYTEQCDETMTHMQKWYRNRLLFEMGLREIACEVDDEKGKDGSEVGAMDAQWSKCHAIVGLRKALSWRLGVVSRVSADYELLAYVAGKDCSLTSSFVNSVVKLQGAEESLLSRITFKRNDGEDRPSSRSSSPSINVVMAIVWRLSRRHLSKPDFLHEILHTMCNLKLLSGYAVAVGQWKQLSEEGKLSGHYMAMHLRTVADKARCECEHVRCMVLEYLGDVYTQLDSRA